MLTLLRRNADLRRVAAAGLVSLAGDYLLFVGLAYLVYDLTGSTLASGATMLAAYLPQVFLGSVAGVMVDRWDRRRTMVACDVLQAVGLLPLLAVGEGRIWVVYAVTLWQGCVEQFFRPAQQALVPSLVPADDLVAANAAVGQSQHVARLVGAAAGGLVAAHGGIAALALADCATFAVSALLLSRVSAVARAPREPEPVAVSPVRRVAGEWRDGLRLVSRTRGLRVALVFALVTNVGEGIFATLLAPWVRDVTHAGGDAFGVLVGVQAVGGIAGALLVGRGGRTRNAAAMFGWGAVGVGVVDTALFAYPLLWEHIGPGFVLIALVGVPGAFCSAGFLTVVQTLTEDRYRGRVLGALNAARGVAALCGIGLASWLGEVVGILPVIVFQGVGYVVAGLLVLASRIDHS